MSSASSGAAPAGSASAGAAPAGSALASNQAEKTGPQKTDVLLDTKLPPKVVSAGGSYSLAVNDPRGLTRTEVVTAVERSTKTVDGCFGDIFKAGGKKGKISFSVIVDGTGKFKSLKTQDDELKDKKLPKCLEGALKKVEWSKPSEKGGATFVIEWVIQS